MQFFSFSLPSSVLALALLFTAGQASAQISAAAEAMPGQSVGQVSITNIGHQPLAPILVVTHSKSAMPIFTPGMAASMELATLAETGNPAPLEAMVRTHAAVAYATHVTGMSGKVMPGETVTAEVVFDARHQSVSIAGMLVHTNDAFAAYQGARIPAGYDVNSYKVHVWDAGSEANTEACEDVPGVHCEDTYDNARNMDGAEGMVLIHPGIHGMGDVPVRYDWRGPVAILKVSAHGMAR
ncbi:MAG: spondin domain-containing protein [Bryobacterales bacterium]|nr:spondin domain-containing protein [Bryobacterales bacterium]MDE0628050.1 spondin domain-containing protein [Bryobacterales bacterium]